jgi:hypothetical protein
MAAVTLHPIHVAGNPHRGFRQFRSLFESVFHLCFFSPINSHAAFIFTESFDDTSLASRGWYDFGNVQLSTSERIDGSTSSIEYHFNQGSSTPASGRVLRRKFPETDSIYIRYRELFIKMIGIS